jgi:uncharacterized damage-inducible protein DinB
MTKDTIRLLAAYNAYANKGMNEAIAKLSPEQWEKNFGGYFGSVRDLCAHIYSGSLTWLKRLISLRSFEVAKAPLLGTSLAKDEKPFATVQEYLAKCAELDALFTAFAAELTDEDLASDLSFKNWKGETQTKNFGGLCMHMFNHATHHRGAVSTYLDIAGIENDFSNLIRII